MRQFFRPHFSKGITAVTAMVLLSAGLHALTVPDIETQARNQFGDRGGNIARDWRQMVLASQGLSTREKLKTANSFFNENIDYVSDASVYGAEDYWASPLEFMGRGKGDCEDYSIAKYASLLLMGVPAESLRMVYVKAKRSGITQAHMVLAWYESPMAVPLILDNLEFSIMPASQRGDLTPIFSFNGKALWVGTKAQPAKTNPLNRLSRWRQVLDKMRREGFNLGF